MNEIRFLEDLQEKMQQHISYDEVKRLIEKRIIELDEELNKMAEEHDKIRPSK